ncbi:MAG: GNAT family N-acetyltransferase [Candidatus Acidiferrales bacterium]
MPTLLYRLADKSDIPGMAYIRASEWETEEYWRVRISRYMDCEVHPQHALMPRVAYVALEDTAMVGFIAGHLTRRYACDGELEWINVILERRGSGIASELLRLLAAWFAEQKALRVCVDAEPSNIAARRFYKRHGAADLNAHWLVWNDISAVLRNE